MADIKDADGKVDYIKLCKIAIDHADAITDSTPDTPAELIEYAIASGKPFLPYEKAQEGASAYYDFYKTL